MTRPVGSGAGLRGVLGSRVGRRLLGLLLGCALLPLLAFAWLAAAQVSSRLRSEAEAGLHSAAKGAGMALASRLLRLRNDFDLIREELARSGPGRLGRVQPELRERLARKFRSVWVRVGQDSRLELGEPGGSLAPLSPAALAHLRSGATLILAPAGPAGELPRPLAMLHELPGGAVLVGELRAQEVWDVDELRGDGSEVMVLGSDLTPAFTTVQPLPDLAPLRAALAGSPASGTVRWEVQGEEHLARYWRLFFNPQFGADWIIVQSRAAAAVLAPLFGFQQWFGLIALVSCLVVVLASLVQIRRTMDPIQELHAATHRVAEGDYSVPVRVLSGDELGELASSFNAMTDQLVESIQRRERTEQALVAARDAALAAARAKADFLTNVSHELRTPLTSILSAAEVLRSYPDEDPALRAEFLGAIAEHASRLGSIIDKVLQLSSGGNWELRPTALEPTLRAALAATPRASRARVTLSVDADLPPVAGVHDRLTQLWIHLIDNAVKFSPEGAPVEVCAQRRGEQIAVEVRDQGAGIASADLPGLFEPFRQVGRDLMTGKASGTGLGLTLARHIVERHGGRIEVDSEPGRGSTFRVLLQLAAAPVAELVTAG